MSERGLRTMRNPPPTEGWRESIRRIWDDLHDMRFLQECLGISTETPQPVGATGATGTATKSLPDDHVHKGVSSWGIDGGTLFYGAAGVKQGTNITLAAAAGVVTINSAGEGLSLYASDPEPVADIPAVGNSELASPGNHVHLGISIAEPTSGGLVIRAENAWGQLTGAEGDVVIHDGDTYTNFNKPGAGTFTHKCIDGTHTWVED